jgi:hypothetical protein
MGESNRFAELMLTEGKCMFQTGKNNEIIRDKGNSEVISAAMSTGL